MPKRFYANIEFDPIIAKSSFYQIMDEVVDHFTTDMGTKVKITIEIEAESLEGFKESLQYIVKKNCRTLKFDMAEFEEE